MNRYIEDSCDCERRKKTYQFSRKKVFNNNICCCLAFTRPALLIGLLWKRDEREAHIAHSDTLELSIFGKIIIINSLQELERARERLHIPAEHNSNSIEFLLIALLIHSLVWRVELIKITLGELWLIELWRTMIDCMRDTSIWTIAMGEYRQGSLYEIFSFPPIIPLAICHS